LYTTGRWRLGLSFALLTAVMWGVLPIALKALLDRIDPYTLTWYRFLAAGALLGGFLIQRGRLPSLRALGGRRWVLFSVAVVGLTGNYLLYLLGLRYVTPATSQMVIQLAPVFLLLGGLIFFRESFRPSQWFGLLVLVAGLALFFNNRLDELLAAGGHYHVGVAITVVAALVWAAFALAQKQLLRSLDSAQILVLIYAAAVVFILPLVELGQVRGLSSLEWGLLLFCCVNTVIAYGAFAEALVHWEASRVSSVLAITPLITLLSIALGVRWFPGLVEPERINMLSVAGACLVVIGSATAALGRRRRNGAIPAPLE
jgi:drug/metabolite transporter (DMT)-like permease